MFLFATRRTRSGRMIKTSYKAVLGRHFQIIIIIIIIMIIIIMTFIEEINFTDK